MTRHVICLDGTWNVLEDTTNVWRMHSLVDIRNADQTCFYDQGVGTKWYDRLTGGMFGAGLFENVREAYNWLVPRYVEGDEIFIFGFSRGAFTALCLANLIDRCGVLRAESGRSFLEVYNLYKCPGFHYSSLAASRFREDNSWHVRAGKHQIDFLGLWDNVSAMFLRRAFSEPDHSSLLPQSVGHVAHALAIDEHRWLFRPTVFSTCPPGCVLEQRWFSGAHANVGGGYPNDPLSLRTFDWMARKAAKVGLVFRVPPTIDNRGYVTAIQRDSYLEFLSGLGPFLQPCRHYRAMSAGLSETIDPCAVERIKLTGNKGEISKLRTFLEPRRVVMKQTAKNDRPKSKRALTADEVALIEIYQRQDANTAALWLHYLVVGAITIALTIVVAFIFLRPSSNGHSNIGAGVCSLISVGVAFWTFAIGNQTAVHNMQLFLEQLGKELEGSTKDKDWSNITTKPASEVVRYHKWLMVLVTLVCVAFAWAISSLS